MEEKTIYCYKDGKHYNLTDNIEDTKGMKEVKVCDLDTLEWFLCGDLIYDNCIVKIKEGKYIFKNEYILDSEGDITDILGYIKIN